MEVNVLEHGGERYVFSIVLRKNANALYKIIGLLIKQKLNIVHCMVDGPMQGNCIKVRLEVHNSRLYLDIVMEDLIADNDIESIELLPEHALLDFVLAIFCVNTGPILEHDQMQHLIERHNIKLLEMNREKIMLAKMGTKKEVMDLKLALEPMGMTEYSITGKQLFINQINKKQQYETK